jgi:hypothetical protein
MSNWLGGWGEPVPQGDPGTDGDGYPMPGMIPDSQVANLSEMTGVVFDRQ